MPAVAAGARGSAYYCSAAVVQADTAGHVERLGEDIEDLQERVHNLEQVSHCLAPAPRNRYDRASVCRKSSSSARLAWLRAWL